MATSRPFAYNTGSTITGTQQTGSLAIGTASVAYQDTRPGGIQWWQGPDEDLGYVIAFPVPGGDVHTPTPISASVRFKRSSGKTDSAFINLVNNAYNQSFTTTAQSYNYVTGSLFWTSFTNPTSGSTAITGSGSINFNATSWFTVPGTSSWAVGTGDFTVEWFQYQTNNGNENYIFSLGTTDTFAASVQSGGNRLRAYANGSLLQNPTISNLNNAWFHVALSRTGSTMNMYFSGSRVATFANSSNITDSSSILYIGTKDGAGGTGDNWPGLVTNFRWTTGQCLYNGTTLTVPTANLTTGSFTKLLLLAQTSGTLNVDSTGLNTVTNVGATFSTNVPF